MSKSNISYICVAEPNLEQIKKELNGLEYDLSVHICNSEGETIEAVKGADLIINEGVPMPASVINEIDSAYSIVSFGHGFDRIDDEAATKNKIMLTNTAGFCSEEVSNHAIMLLLSCAKHLNFLNDLVKSGQWDKAPSEGMRKFLAEKKLHMPPVYNQTLGLIGFGNIARATARKAKAFGLKVVSYDPYVEPWIAREYEVELYNSLESIAAISDYVSIHLPLNNETKKIINKEFFKNMKNTAFIINTCRGGTIDEKAMIDALKSGCIAGAGLDVFEEEPIKDDNILISLPNVIMTPHTAGTSTGSDEVLYKYVGQEAYRVLNNQWPMSLVNPEVKNMISNRNPAMSK